MNKSLVLVSILVISLLLIACTPKPQVTDEESGNLAEAGESEQPAEQLTGGAVAEEATAEETAAEPVQKATAPPSQPGIDLLRVHVIEVTDNGFVPNELAIKVGETVVWKNVRTGKVDKTMIVGNRQCSNIKSNIFGPGGTFSWTFDHADECTIVDGIFTTKLSKIIIT